ncbi:MULTISPECIES: hypothetical protein [unclassified Burkholderia]|uniref:hypothetical protein n=1 Tax=unclassified Burkholderia TaxID=2613784 RepID=UPI0014222131|nr:MULTISPECIES: hypothetical protein [unclassified Burkholderia]NIE85194.1 hypothetical protein [Burkholderia sp. Tr-860]NIF63586.1 hypothetical protein [Burkholderia sp. Cy-647]NIF97204.1 hypothetical protein [Burkholderia sp. Ax-1720]
MKTSSSLLTMLVALAASVPAHAQVSSGITLNGLMSVTDMGRTGGDNAATITIQSNETLDFPDPDGITHYGLIFNGEMNKGANGDRIGIGSVQWCDATAPGKSCVASSSLVRAQGTVAGNYTGSNPRVLVLARDTAPDKSPLPASGAAVGQEIDVETHVPMLIRNGLRIADENQSTDAGPIAHGMVEDAAIAIVTDSAQGNLGFDVGLQFGENLQGYPQYWPILPGGTLIQASNPNVKLAYGLDLSGATAGFSGQAIALPMNAAGGGIAWGASNTAGLISSSASTGGGRMNFSDAGTVFANASGGTVLNIGGDTGADLVNDGYMIEKSLNGYVYCNGEQRCSASPSLGLAGTTAGIGGSALAAGRCTTGSVPIPGATSSMSVTATPAADPGDGYFWQGLVSSAGVVTVKLCAVVPGTPSVSTYNVRVLP